MQAICIHQQFCLIQEKTFDINSDLQNYEDIQLVLTVK